MGDSPVEICPKTICRTKTAMVDRMTVSVGTGAVIVSGEARAVPVRPTMAETVMTTAIDRLGSVGTSTG